MSAVTSHYLLCNNPSVTCNSYNVSVSAERSDGVTCPLCAEDDGQFCPMECPSAQKVLLTGGVEELCSHSGAGSMLCLVLSLSEATLQSLLVTYSKYMDTGLR